MCFGHESTMAAPSNIVHIYIWFCAVCICGWYPSHQNYHRHYCDWTKCYVVSHRTVTKNIHSQIDFSNGAWICWYICPITSSLCHIHVFILPIPLFGRKKKRRKLLLSPWQSIASVAWFSYAHLFPFGKNLDTKSFYRMLCSFLPLRS